MTLTTTNRVHDTDTDHRVISDNVVDVLSDTPHEDGLLVTFEIDGRRFATLVPERQVFAYDCNHAYFVWTCWVFSGGEE